MPRLRLITGCDPERLLRRAADEFLVRRAATPGEPFPTVPYLLALRQGGLRDDVLEMAAEAGVPGWFDPPLCVFHELPEWLGAPEREVMGDYERLVLLARILRDDEESGVFARLARPDDFVDAVDRLFGELVAESVAPDELARALASRPERDDFERRRDADLSRAYAAYHAELARLKKGDGRDTWAWCARAVESGAADLARSLRGRREVRIFGLQDLRRGWMRLFRALAGCDALDEVAIYSSAPLPELESLAPETERLEEHPVAARLFSDSPERDERARATLVVAPDVDREMEWVARRVRELVDAGTAPHRIAVVSRQARPHVDRALAALAGAGVPATARRRVGLREIPAVRAIGALFDAAAEGWTRRGLAELAEHPYFDCGITARIINHIGFRRRVEGLAAWEGAIRALEREAREHEERLAAGEEVEERRARALPPARSITDARERFGPFAARAKALDAARRLGEWLAWLSDFLERDPWGMRARIHAVPDERFEIARLDIAGWNGLRSIVREWRGAVEELGAGGEMLRAAEFDWQLRACLSGDVALWTPVKRGVQVLESLAAAYRTFDHLFLVGMEGGAFPRSAPSSPVLDEGERAALAAAGVPLEPRAVWDAREKELFRVLVAGARERLTLSYSRLDDGGREVISSAFVEELDSVLAFEKEEIPSHEVVLPGVALYRSDEALAQARHAAAVERAREAGAASPYAGHIAHAELVSWLEEEFGDDRVWSPTQLEEFAKCPWAYFSKRLLRLERVEDPGEDMEPSVRGSILHDALRRFYDAARSRDGGRPVFLLESDAEWAMPLVDEAVEAAFDEATRRGWTGVEALRPAKLAELGRIARGLLAWEMRLHEDMTDPKTKKRKAPAMIRTGVHAHEVAFGDMVYEHDGVRLRYRGFIDRVEVSVDERAPGVMFVAATDYKTTKYSTPGGGEKKAWEDGVVLQVPLYAHALSKLYADHVVARVDYVTLNRPEQVHALELYTFDRKAKEPVESVEAVERWKSALSAAVHHIRRARRGEFPAAPPESCKCPPWCHGRDICRVPGGPR
ncbi:MAG TPA: PD-(D/E)XK nuclease family protein [Gemmatimonadaceae bacterium]|nr:PD-(D/E)XK nuclease family protein [Gemmatimonadaceae bacterium]